MHVFRVAHVMDPVPGSVSLKATAPKKQQFQIRGYKCSCLSLLEVWALLFLTLAQLGEVLRIKRSQ
jgi:hypothetical protein